MARTTRSDVDLFFDHGLDIPSRTFYLGDNEDGLDHVTAAHTIRALHVLDRTEGTITIKLNSVGGDCYHGLAVHDAIKTCNNEVVAIGYGAVMSMGLIVFQAADRRILAPNATVLWHYGSEGFDGHAKDLERRAQESLRLRQVHDDILLARIRAKQPSYTAAKLRKRFEFDTYMSAREAVDFGFADEILS